MLLRGGESLEEAACEKRTWEETDIEVGEVIYHSSQPRLGRHDVKKICSIQI
ncbi:hypothetical protein AAHE18_07G188300 [Arachis hypogaea]